MIQNRNIQLNLLKPSTCKSVVLDTLFESYNLACSDCLEYWKSNKGITQTAFHHATYKDIRSKYKLPADYTISARVTVWNRRKITKIVKRVPIRLTNKLFRYDTTPRGNPVIAITSFGRKRIILPIKQDNAFKRFKDIEYEGYIFNSMLLLKRNGSYIIQAVMQKDIPNPEIRPNTLGIDIGSANLCALSVNNGRILKQLYFGRDVAVIQHKISNRRSKLQSKADKGSSKAIKALKKLKRYQSNFVNTRSWQVASKVVDLAIEYNANINIENLKNLRTGRKLGNSKGRKVNGLISRIPYAKFFHALDCIALRKGVKVSRVSPRHTSQRCYKCGHVGKDNWKDYKIFSCSKCGLTAHRDRVASTNIANPVLERTDLVSTTNSVQTSKTEEPVTVPVCVNDVESFGVVHLNDSPEAKSPRL
jgi:putative transposase